MGIYDKAAQSILRSDRAKAEAFGGQLLSNVKDITADEEMATLDIDFVDGSEKVIAMIGKFGGMIDTESLKKRSVAPADVHDAVKATIFDALGVHPKNLEA